MMSHFKSHSGLSLVFAGLGGLGFFWLTDPRNVFGQWFVGEGLDAANQAHVGTIVGLAGSTSALLIGLWLVTRRAA